MHVWPAKDPDEVIDYQFDWSDRLEDAETISSSAFSLAEGDVTLGANDTAGAVTTIWLSGGTLGTVSIVTNRIITSEGRTYDESAKLRIRSK